MDWLEIRTEDDAECLMERVYKFHDWYVAGFSYDPLAQSKENSLSLSRYKVDVDALTVVFRWDHKRKDGTWPEVRLEFGGLHVFRFSNSNDPDPLWGCAIKKTNGNCWLFADNASIDFSKEELAYPETIVSNILVVCEEIRWKAD